MARVICIFKRIHSILLLKAQYLWSSRCLIDLMDQWRYSILKFDFFLLKYFEWIDLYNKKLECWNQKRGKNFNYRRIWKWENNIDEYFAQVLWIIKRWSTNWRLRCLKIVVFLSKTFLNLCSKSSLHEWFCTD